MTFSDDQLNAAKAFAYTMIVVDDEPVRADDQGPITEVHTPGRGDATATQREDTEPVEKSTHDLDAKALVRSALDVGLVCSVVNPTGDEDAVAKNVAKTSMRADIVSLDWHMNDDDDGNLACDIIAEILRGDEAIGGRLRLIAIYTGNNKKAKILGQITERLNDEKVGLSDKVVNEGEILSNTTGLRLVWREKAKRNAKLESAVLEADLPQVLLTEFANLSKGLLSNVALATISSMRDTTHHVLSKFSSELDGPFFHHRALLSDSSDSMDYAVSIVIGALKSEVNKAQIAERFSTPDAIKRRLEAIESGGIDFTLRYIKDGEEKEFNFLLDDIMTSIEDGGVDDKWPTDLINTVKARQQNTHNPRPSKGNFKSDFSTVFSSSRDAAIHSMMHFSFLTTSQSSELSKIHRKTPPKLDLGSIIHSDGEGYFLCLQATCDTVRGAGLFFFVPLRPATNGTPEIIVPHGKTDNQVNYVGLSVPKNSYTKSRSMDFGAINDAIGHIPIPYDSQRDYYHVSDVSGNDYRWLANLKYKRALRIAQNMSQEISRVGFDEFEPFREK